MLSLPLAILLLAARTLASPPSYWISEVVPHGLESAYIYELHPSPPKTACERIASDKRSSLVRRKNVDQLAKGYAMNDTAQSSTSNSFDKLQSVSFLSNAYNVAINVSTATDPQVIFVQLDTASADIWIVAKSCTDAACTAQDIELFDENLSPSYRAFSLEVDSDAGVSVKSSNPIRNSTSHADDTTTFFKRVSSTIHPDRQAAALGSLPKIKATQDQQTSVPLSIQYDSSEQATGTLGVETFTLSGLSMSDQIFGLIRSTNISLSQQGIGGVLGLGFARGSSIARGLVDYQSNISASSQPLMSRILRSSGVSYPLFSLSLTRRGGRLTIGAVDPSILPDPASRGLVEWHDVQPFPSGDASKARSALVNEEGPQLGPYVYWALQLRGVGINGTGITLYRTYAAVGRYPLALIDTGTAGIIGPPQDVQALFSQIRDARHVGNGRFVVPCDTQVRMSFSFGTRNLTLLPEDYIIGPAAGNPYLCFAWPLAEAGTSDGIDWVLGQAFLRAQYTLFSSGIPSVEAPKIGFYPLRANASFSIPSSSLFAPEATASLSAFLQNEAVPVPTVLPNSLVPLSTTASSTAPYLFQNATETPSLGTPPQGQGGASSSHAALLPNETGNLDVPAISNTSEPLPLPDNPAAEVQDGAGRTGSSSLAALIAATLFLSTLMGGMSFLS